MIIKNIILFLTFIHCSFSNNSNQREIALKEKEIALKQRELQFKEDSLNRSVQKLNLSEAVIIAENMFSKYLPKIEESHSGIIDIKYTYTGDFTNDGIKDIAIVFTIVPGDGGNAILAQGISFYTNTGKSVKVIAGFDPYYLFSFKKIFNNKIYITKLIYKSSDPRCCPSISREIELTIRGNKVLEKILSSE